MPAPARSSSVRDAQHEVGRAVLPVHSDSDHVESSRGAVSAVLTMCNPQCTAVAGYDHQRTAGIPHPDVSAGCPTRQPMVGIPHADESGGPTRSPPTVATANRPLHEYVHIIDGWKTNVQQTQPIACPLLLYAATKI